MNKNEIPRLILFQAIETKYRGPTNTKGSRILAKASAGAVIVPYDHGLDLPQNHYAAAIALRDKLKWGHKITGGSLDDGNYVWVLKEEGIDA